MELKDLKIGTCLRGMFHKFLYIEDITDRYVECLRIDFKAKEKFRIFRLPLRDWDAKMINYIPSYPKMLIEFIFEKEIRGE